MLCGRRDDPRRNRSRAFNSPWGVLKSTPRSSGDEVEATLTRLFEQAAEVNYRLAEAIDFRGDDPVRLTGTTGIESALQARTITDRTTALHVLFDTEQRPATPIRLIANRLPLCFQARSRG